MQCSCNLSAVVRGTPRVAACKHAPAHNTVQQLQEEQHSEILPAIACSREGGAGRVWCWAPADIGGVDGESDPSAADEEQRQVPLTSGDALHQLNDDGNPDHDGHGAPEVAEELRSSREARFGVFIRAVSAERTMQGTPVQNAATHLENGVLLLLFELVVAILVPGEAEKVALWCSQSALRNLQCGKTRTGYLGPGPQSSHACSLAAWQRRLPLPDRRQHARYRARRPQHPAGAAWLPPFCRLRSKTWMTALGPSRGSSTQDRKFQS